MSGRYGGRRGRCGGCRGRRGGCRGVAAVRVRAGRCHKGGRGHAGRLDGVGRDPAGLAVELVAVLLVAGSNGSLAAVSSAAELLLLGCRPRSVALLTQVWGGCCRHRSLHDADAVEEAEGNSRGHTE